MSVKVKTLVVARKDELMDIYDADMDDLDSSDLGEEEKRALVEQKSSKYDPGMQSNMSSLRKAVY
jgi:hypothetical protein